jgi:hypothetical protein
VVEEGGARPVVEQGGRPAGGRAGRRPSADRSSRPPHPTADRNPLPPPHPDQHWSFSGTTRRRNSTVSAFRWPTASDSASPTRLGYPRPVARQAGRRAPVAQRIEHLTTDQKVWGSNPYGRADVFAGQPLSRTVGRSEPPAIPLRIPLPVPPGRCGCEPLRSAGEDCPRLPCWCQLSLCSAERSRALTRMRTPWTIRACSGTPGCHQPAASPAGPPTHQAVLESGRLGP